MFTQPGVSRTWEGSNTNILNVLDMKLLGTYFLGKDSLEIYVDGMFTQPIVPRTWEGSNTNIVG